MSLLFGGTDWWTPFVDKLIVPHLVSWFIAISVIPPNEGYDVFHMLLTRCKPVMSLESMMKKVLKRFMEKWTDGCATGCSMCNPQRRRPWPGASSGCNC